MSELFDPRSGGSPSSEPLGKTLSESTTQYRPQREKAFETRRKLEYDRDTEVEELLHMLERLEVDKKVQQEEIENAKKERSVLDKQLGELNAERLKTKRRPRI